MATEERSSASVRKITGKRKYCGYLLWAYLIIYLYISFNIFFFYNLFKTVGQRLWLTMLEVGLRETNLNILKKIKLI